MVIGHSAHRGLENHLKLIRFSIKSCRSPWKWCVNSKNHTILPDIKKPLFSPHPHCLQREITEIFWKIWINICSFNNMMTGWCAFVQEQQTPTTHKIEKVSRDTSRPTNKVCIHYSSVVHDVRLRVRLTVHARSSGGTRILIQFVVNVELE